MATFPRENDMEIGKIFFYCNERDKYATSMFKYGHPYKIENITGTFPDISITLRLVLTTEYIQTPIVTGTEYFFMYFMLLDDEEMFALHLAQDTEVAGITVENEPEPPEVCREKYLAKKNKYDGK